jgi:hypothetical protein
MHFRRLVLLFNGKPQATAFIVVAGLKRSRLRLAVKQLFLPPSNSTSLRSLIGQARKHPRFARGSLETGQC